MTTVNTETGELLDAPSYGDVKRSVDMAKSSLEEAAEQIVWQIENRAWVVLGYGTWDEMREAEYGGAAFMVPRAERPELVARMRRAGLTQAEIANTAGVGQSTVDRDLKTHMGNEPAPTITNARGQQRPASYTPTPQGEAQPVAQATSAPSADPVENADTPRPAEPDTAVIEDFVQSGPDVQLARWRKTFMDAIYRSGQVMTFTPADVADKADAQLVAELERLSHELNNYVSRVRAKRPSGLRAINGGSR